MLGGPGKRALGGQCSTHEWLEASRLVYEAIDRWSEALGAAVPVALALFGGCRGDAPDFVLRLHAADLAIALDTLAGTSFAFQPEELDLEPSGYGVAEVGQIRFDEDQDDGVL